MNNCVFNLCQVLLPTLARGAALNLAARLTTAGLGLLILVLVSRFGPTVQGAFALFVAIESVLMALFSGLGLLLAREISNRQTPAGPLLMALLRAALVLGCLATLALLVVAALTESEPYRHLWLLAVAAPFVLLVPTASGLWLGQGRMGPLNLPQIAAPALVLAALQLVPQPLELATVSIFPVLGVWVVCRMAVAVVTGWAAASETAWAAADATALRGQWRFVAVIGATSMVSLLNYRATLFLLERHGGLAVAGVYSVAVQVAELLWLLSSAVTVSAYHRIGAPDPAVAATTTLRTVQVNIVATLIAAPLLYCAALVALPSVLGVIYAGALVPLALLLPGVAAYAAASSLSAYYTNHRGRPQWSVGVAGLSLILTMAIAALTIPRYGAAGAALATSLAYCTAIAVALAIFLRDAGMPWSALFRPPGNAPQLRQ